MDSKRLDDLSKETGLEFLLRMPSKSTLKVNGIGELQPGDFLLMKCQSDIQKRRAIVEALSLLLLPAELGGAEKDILYLDMVGSLLSM